MRYCVQKVELCCLGNGLDFSYDSYLRISSVPCSVVLRVCLLMHVHIIVTTYCWQVGIHHVGTSV